jgi:MYXO-CTERM domain-containing protein
MTARHCVSQTPQQIDCTVANFGGLNGNASNYWITTYPYMFQGTQGWHQAAQIITTPGTKVCGNDMALLILKGNVSANEAPNVTPVVQYMMTEHPRYSTTVTAIGFGNNTVSSGAGTRRIKQQINLQCIPGDKYIPCGMQTQLDVKEFASGDGTCSGDSGSSAYEQKNFDNGNWVSFGVLSRGGTNGSFCVGGIYTRTDSWASLIVQTAMQAANMGGYAPPPWTQPAPMLDGGSEGGTLGMLGAPCGDITDCAKGFTCQTQPGAMGSICTQMCDPQAMDCPAGYQCLDTQNGGYCFPAPPPDPTPEPQPDSGGPVDMTQPNGNAGGCAVAADPSKPVPWKGGGIAIAAIFALILRRKRR